jgi:hypothetical protein
MMKKKVIVLVLTMTVLLGTTMAQDDILYERWNGDGSPDELLTYTETPDYTEFLTSIEYGPDIADDYRSRITAILVPPVSGNYTFWILADNDSVLWLSTDEDPANAFELCRETEWAFGWDEWEDGGDEESLPVALVGGNRYWLRVGHSEDTGEDFVRIGWGSTEAGIPDHTVITDEYIGGSETARNPSPSYGATNVSTTVVLEWDPPMDFTPIAYDVYLSSTDPNANKAKDQVVSHDPCETYDPDPDLEYNTKYWWRVNSYDPCDVIRSPGGVWSFTTWPTWPVFTTDVESTTVEAASAAQFYVETPRSNTFQWWKEGTPDTQVNDGDDGGDVSVVSDGTSSTLTISNLEQADEGYYYCKASGNGITESSHGRLLTKRLMGHWKFDAMSLNDAVAGNHGTLTDPNANNPPPPPPSGPTWFAPGAKGGAIKLQTGELYIDIPNQEYFNFHAQGFTVSAWIKTEQEGWGVVVSKTDRKEPRTGWLLHHYVDTAYINLRENGEVSYNGGVADNEWHMLAGTYDEETGLLALYVDGVKRDEVGPIWELTETDMPLKIGTELASDHPGEDTIIDYDGLVDDVKIYSYAQDAYEVATEYTDIVEDSSICVEPVPGDLNGDCVINIADVIEVVSEWLECGFVPASACN